MMHFAHRMTSIWQTPTALTDSQSWTDSEVTVTALWQLCDSSAQNCSHCDSPVQMWKVCTAFHKAYWYCAEIMLVKSNSCLRCRSLGLVRTMIYCVEIQQYLYYTNMWPSLQHLLYIYVRLSYSTESCLLTMILLLGACCAPWFRLHSSIWCSGIEISPLPPEIMWATMQLVHSQYRNGFRSQASLVR